MAKNSCQKKIEGKVFTLFCVIRGRRNASSIAKELRSCGYYARVFPESGLVNTWAIWKRKM